MFNNATDGPTSDKLPTFKDDVENEAVKAWLVKYGLWEDELSDY